MARKLVLCVALLLGCDDGYHEEIVRTAPCAGRREMSGGCAGAPREPICSGTVCVDDLACKVVLSVSDAETLAAVDARPGDCIALAPGEYDVTVKLQRDVSLLGRSPDEVRVRGVRVEGEGSRYVRGISIGSEGVVVRGGRVELDRVRVRTTTNPSIDAASSEVVVRDSTITGGRGAWLYCACSVDRRVRVKMTNTLVEQSKGVGIHAVGVDLDLRHVVVSGVDHVDFRHGRGIEVSNGGSLTASHVRIESTADDALVLSGATGKIGPSFAVAGPGRGVHFGAIPSGGVVIDGFAIEGTSGFGISIDGLASDVVLRNGKIASVRAMNVPTDLGGTATIGQGLLWDRGALVNVESTVTIADSAVRAADVHAQAKGSFAAVLAGSDAKKGIYVHGPGDPKQHPDLVIAKDTIVSYGPTTVPHGAVVPLPTPVATR